MPMKREKQDQCARLDATGAAAIAALVGMFFAFLAPHPIAAGQQKEAKPDATQSAVDKKFKGKLPILELDEEEAIVHALNRLAYGPRPGDVARIRQIGLEKWVDEQLHPEAIDDSALDVRLEMYATLTMSSKQLFDKFPPPEAVAKKEGITREQAQEQQRDKAREAVARLKAGRPEDSG